MHFALVCLGGAVGTGARYLLGGLAVRWLGGEFPYGTLLVNVIGSFLIGLVQELALGAKVVPEHVRVVLAVGLLGGFTTYSAFAYESLRLVVAGSWTAAALYVGTHHRAVLRGLLAGHRRGPAGGGLGLPGNFFPPLLRFHHAGAVLAERLIVPLEHRVPLGVELQPLHQHPGQERQRHRHHEDQRLEDPAGAGGLAHHGPA